MPIATRFALTYLAVTGLVVGLWASTLPASFYASFPGFGRTWVSVDGPFNEHLIRDAGAAYLMIGALAGLRLLRPAAVSSFAVGGATLFFNLPHLLYHATHLGMYLPLDRALNLVALLTAALCSVWLMTKSARARA